MGPVSDSTIETLTQVMRYRESLPEKWNRIPLIGSRYENIFNSVSHADLLNFEGAYTLGLCVHPDFDSLLPNLKMKINNLKKTVFSSLKITHNSAKNVQRGEATSLMIDALLFKKGEITKAHKEMIKDSYKDTIMKSYQTRIRD